MDMKDKELIEQMEALEEVIDWLEKKEDVYVDEANNSPVTEHELDEWLKSPKLKKVLKWLER